MGIWASCCGEWRAKRPVVSRYAAAAPVDEVSPSQLDHVAGVDEPIAVGQRRPSLPT